MSKKKRRVYFKTGGYDVDDLMWVIGCIDDRGAITARHTNSDGLIMHSREESRGRRWRWNIWGQEFTATLNPAFNMLTGDEFTIVTDWLERKGYKREESKGKL